MSKYIDLFQYKMKASPVADGFELYLG